MEHIVRTLKNSGLRDNEIRVYLYVLEHGATTPPQIARGTKISRPNLYGSLQTLRERGLIDEQRKGSRKAYITIDPSVLVQVLEHRTEEMRQILPDLRGLYAAQANKPVIKYFEGAEQVKEIFYEMLEAKSVYGVASTKKLYDALGWDFFKKYVAKMKERGIVLHDILTQDSPETSAKTPIALLRGLYDMRMFPKGTEDIAVDILIWNDKVALISTDAPIFGTLIKNQAIASVMKMMFKLSWKQLS
ncbi:MAG: helix-turn-helix domain-containing protein [Patescibacteria group bacterium]